MTLRPFDRGHDTIAVQAIDTSYASSARFETVIDAGCLTLVQRPWNKSREMRFSVDVTSPLCDYAWVAEVDQRLVGFIATQLQEWNRRLAIWHFYVDRTARRGGIGKSLMETALAHGRTLGAVTAWAETSNCNVTGIDVYRRLGFELCGCDTSLYRVTSSEGQFAVYMAQSLVTE